MQAIGWSALLQEERTAAALPGLEYPLPGVARVAVIGARYRAQSGVVSFPHWRSSELERWRPQALAGTRAELFSLGQLRERRYLTLDYLVYPLVVFSTLREGPLTAADHDRLWELFGLPVYEQIRDAAGALLARECDARTGYHLLPDENGVPKLGPARLRAAGWQGDLVPGLCPCGELCLRWLPAASLRALSLAAGD